MAQVCFEEFSFPRENLRLEFDHIQIVVGVLPVGLGGDIEDGVYCGWAGYDIQLSNGRNEYPFPGAQEKDGNPRPAIVSQDVAHAPVGLLRAAHPASLWAHRH
jgi:hypothetical protein